MVARIVTVICCWGSLSLAASSWSAPPPDTLDAGAADVGDTISTIVSLKAGRSSMRISAGLSGDWDVVQPVRDANPRPRVALTPLKASLTSIPSEDPLFESPAAALPLPPAALAALPGLLVAYVVSRRFSQH